MHQRHMRECLREVTDHSFRHRVVLFGKQPDIIRQADEPLEHVVRFVHPALQSEVVHQPEATSQKRAFSRR